MGLNLESQVQKIDFNLSSFLWNRKENKLDLLKELVGLMNGKLTVQNGEDQNMTFLVSLPNNSSFSSSIFSEKESLNSNGKYQIENTFLKRIQIILEENIEDESFGIPQLCQAACLSRSQLHNKIKAATGISTSIFIRNIRLKKAKHLIEHTDKNVSEVAYDVGFKDPSYFSRLFTEKYGISPMKLRNL